MRLICPSCGAQYEVDESVIPELGRDVQCSNCGHAWFQKSAAQLRAEESGASDAEAGAVAEEVDGPDAPEDAAEDATDAEEREVAEQEEPERSEDVWDFPEPEPVTEAEFEDENPEVIEDPAPIIEALKDSEPSGDEIPEEAEDVLETDVADDLALDSDEVESADNAFADEAEDGGWADGDADEDTTEDIDEDEGSVPAPAFSRRTLDDAVKNVLREEAEREHQARAAEGSDLESQPDLGIAAAAPIGIAGAAAAQDDEVQDRVVRVRGDEDDLDDDSLVSRSSRRELLPDIEEINSTLRATSERGDEPASFDAPETMRRQRSGFRLGFSTTLLIAVLLLALYLLAPLVGRNFPAAEPALTSYVSGVDAARAWLDVKMKSMTEAIRGAQDG